LAENMEIGVDQSIWLFYV